MSEIRKKGDPVLGAKLRKIREDAELSQEELARRLGVKRAQISRVESGTRGTGAVLVSRWYRACGYELESVKVGTSDQAETLALAAADLPEGELDSVIELVAAWPRLAGGRQQCSRRHPQRHCHHLSWLGQILEIYVGWTLCLGRKCTNVNYHRLESSKLN